MPNSKSDTPSLQAVSAYVEDLFKDHLSPKHLFHNYKRTEEVVHLTEKIIKHMNLPDEDQENVLLAAWFQDTGYALGYENYVGKSVKQAQAFLEQQVVAKDQVREVSRLILSTCTQNNHEPLDQLEQILRDAKMGYLSQKKYFSQRELLRAEKSFFLEEEVDQHTWECQKLDELADVPFYTTYAKEHFEEGRSKNILKQKERVEASHKNKEKDTHGKNLGRGIDTLFRITLRNHTNLSSIADGKANMMISINTILLSLGITLVGSGFTFGGQMMAENIELVFALDGSHDQLNHISHFCSPFCCSKDISCCEFSFY